jgi:hypothetical protein
MCFSWPTPTPPAPHPPHMSHTPPPYLSADPTPLVHTAPPPVAPPVPSHCTFSCTTNASTATQTVAQHDYPENPIPCTTGAMSRPSPRPPQFVVLPLPAPCCVGAAVDQGPLLPQYTFVLMLIREGNNTRVSRVSLFP